MVWDDGVENGGVSACCAKELFQQRLQAGGLAGDFICRRAAPLISQTPPSSRAAVLVGGDSMEAQFAELAAFPDILVATPGGCMWLPHCCLTLRLMV